MAPFSLVQHLHRLIRLDLFDIVVADGCCLEHRTAVKIADSVACLEIHAVGLGLVADLATSGCFRMNLENVDQALDLDLDLDLV